VIEELLRRGEWREFLPGERLLSERLQVGRSTLHAALQALKQRGVVRAAARHRTRIVAAPPRRAARSAIVGLLLNQPLEMLHSTTALWLLHLQRRLHLDGLDLRIHDERLPGRQRGSKRLDALVRLTHAECWVLFGPSEKVQRWFAARGIRALVVGTTEPLEGLAGLGVDHRAACRHAAGSLLRLGHRRVALVLPSPMGAENSPSEHGFREAFESHPDATPLLFPHDGTPRGIRHCLDLAFQGGRAPTALLVAHSRHAATVAGELLRRGLRIPGDVSLVSRDYDPFLEHLVPPVTSYRYNWNALARRIARLVASITRRGALPQRAAVIVPSRFEGGSVGPPPGARARLD
jgi:DNA-binding LacI/PurR family transcriptional regulator